MLLFGSKERETILDAATSFVLQASRLWATEPILQTLRREICLDLKQERFSDELSAFSAKDRVFTGALSQGNGIYTTIELSKHILQMNEQSLQQNVVMLLFALHSVVANVKYRKLVVDFNERIMWPSILHNLHLEGNTAAAAILAEHMSHQ